MPNFSATRITAFNAASFAIRGVGQTDIIVYLDSPVAVNIDDFVTPSVQTQLLDTFDIERVEVLRGPQGTLFGKNTTGGLVNVTTKRPSSEEGVSSCAALAGSFGHYQLQGAVDLPIGDTSRPALRRQLQPSRTATTRTARPTASTFRYS